MAKKRAGDTPQQQQFVEGDGTPFVEPLPPAVQTEVDEYMKILRQRNKFNQKLAEQHDRCIRVMEEHKIPRVPIDDGKKWLKVARDPKLKTESNKKKAETENQAA